MAKKITFDELKEMNNEQLDSIMANSHPIEMDKILGYEYKGYNVGVPKVFLKLFQKFKKVFYEDKKRNVIRGWNLKAKQDGDPDHYEIVTTEEKTPYGPFGKMMYWLSGVRGTPAHGFYTVYPASEDKRFHKYPHALLVNYAEGANGFLNITSRLKDYLVAVNPNDETLLLGKGYIDLGLLSVKGDGFFILRKDGPIQNIYDPPAEKK